MTKLFGTDGIRGIANKDLTPELAFKVGRATAELLGDDNGSFLIGKDTRYSGNLIECSLISGIISAGVDVILVGVIPTPAVAYLTRKYKALAGIVISASHNPGEYNGIKIFDNNGLKLNDDIEESIEEKVLNNTYNNFRPIKSDIGKIKYAKNTSKEYLDYLVEKINVDLKGIKVAMDCGHGALYKIGPEAIERLGGEVVSINTEPNGMNINDNCGSTNPNMIKELVIRERADIGISFDGDGDRIIAVDEMGDIIDGDHILSILASYMYEKGRLKNNTVVGTVMTNMGLDDYLSQKDIKVIKTKVGDRYILEEMLNGDYSLGGEQSGHIIILDYNTTGDGLATGLELLKIAKEKNQKLSQLNSNMKNYPQVLVNANVNNKLKYSYNDDLEIQEQIKKVEDMFSGKGRVVIRPSGTEPLVRVMIEAKDYPGIEKIARDLAKFIESKIG